MLDADSELQLGAAADRHHAPRHRAGLRGQGRPGRHPRAGPARRARSCARRSRPRSRVKSELLAQSTPAAARRGRVADQATRATPSGCGPTSPTPSLLVNEALDAGERVLFEGAQGTLLDLDHGTYPFVTSPTRSPAAPAPGSACGRRASARVLGVAKAYTHARRRGPVPQRGRRRARRAPAQRGGEYGTVTGRPRRCGWLDLVGLRYAARVNGFTSWRVTKLDVLSTATGSRSASATGCGTAA